MRNSTYHILFQELLPKELFEYFDLTSINETNPEELRFHLDEKKIVPSEHKDKRLISYGFNEAVKIQDFPIRNKAVYLHIRRRKCASKRNQSDYQ